MHGFKDMKGDFWNLRVTAKTIIDFQNEADFNTFEAFDPEVFKKFFGTAAYLLKLLWLCVRPNAAISEDEFYERIDGDVLEEAHDALVEAVIDSFPQKKSALLRKEWKKGKEEEKARLEDLLKETPNENI